MIQVMDLFILASSLIALNIQDVVASCSEDQWTCDDGSCISLDKKCDGTLNCQDSSDEAETLCQITQSQKCILPEYPANGRYFTNILSAKPGEAYDFIGINITCRQGFVVDGSKSVYCFKGWWPLQMPKCVAQCHLPSHPSVEYRCLMFGSIEGSRACDEFEPTGTVVSPQCRSPVYYSATALTYMRCYEGHWDYIAKCVPECGTATPEGTKLIISVGGEKARRAEVPWHAGIYTKTKDPFQQICGGSLISNDIVLSAAHCFWSSFGGQQPAADFAVAVGKVYRPWASGEEGAQRSDVKAIHLPIRFQGSTANFQDDIAVVVVTIPFEFSSFIRPLCVDFDIMFQESQFRSGNKGKVAGWGLTAENGKESQVLNVIDLPYVSTGTCISESPVSFRGYITSDKFCAGFKDAKKALCKGDSGGGLAFPEADKGTKRYYLRGIASTAATDNSNICNADTYTSFTQLLRHEHFIKKFWKAEYTSNAKQSNGNNGDEKTQKQICTLPDYPTHGTYTTNIPKAKPGDAFDTVTVNVTCRERYATESSSNIYCDKGWWTEKMPKCLAQCYLKPDAAVEFRCFSNEFDGYRPCNEYENSGTLVSPQCTSPDHKSNVLAFMRCTEGEWDYVAECFPDYIPEVRIELHTDSDNKTHCNPVYFPSQQSIVVYEKFLISLHSDEELLSGQCPYSDHTAVHFGKSLRKGKGFYTPAYVLWASLFMQYSWRCTFRRLSSNNTISCGLNLHTVSAPEMGYLAINDKKVVTEITSNGMLPMHSYGNYSFTVDEMVKISCQKTRKHPDDAKMFYVSSAERGNKTVMFLPGENHRLEFYLKMAAENDGSHIACNVTSKDYPSLYHITRVYLHSSATD